MISRECSSCLWTFHEKCANQIGNTQVCIQCSTLDARPTVERQGSEDKKDEKNPYISRTEEKTHYCNSKSPECVKLQVKLVLIKEMRCQELKLTKLEEDLKLREAELANKSKELAQALSIIHKQEAIISENAKKLTIY
jgi:hypothetical protein